MVAVGSQQPGPSIETQFIGNPQTLAAVGSRVFQGTGINLQTASGQSRKFPVTGFNKASARVTTDSFGTAVVEVKGSIDGDNFETLAVQKTLVSATPAQIDFSIVGFPWIVFEVTTNDGSADTNAQCWLYPYRLHLT